MREYVAERSQIARGGLHDLRGGLLGAIERIVRRADDELFQRCGSTSNGVALNANGDNPLIPRGIDLDQAAAGRAGDPNFLETGLKLLELPLHGLGLFHQLGDVGDLFEHQSVLPDRLATSAPRIGRPGNRSQRLPDLGDRPAEDGDRLLHKGVVLGG